MPFHLMRTKPKVTKVLYLKPNTHQLVTIKTRKSTIAFRTSETTRSRIRGSKNLSYLPKFSSSILWSNSSTLAGSNASLNFSDRALPKIMIVSQMKSASSNDRRRSLQRQCAHTRVVRTPISTGDPTRWRRL